MDKTRRQKVKEGSNNLPHKFRIMYEIEKLLNIDENGLGFDILNSKSSNRSVVSQRDLYKLYLALLREKDAERTMVYSGKGIIEIEDAEDMEEDLSDLELTI